MQLALVRLDCAPIKIISHDAHRDLPDHVFSDYVATLSTHAKAGFVALKETKRVIQTINIVELLSESWKVHYISRTVSKVYIHTVSRKISLLIT